MQKCKKLYRGLDMRILTCYNNIMHPGIAKLVSRLVWDQETVRSSRTTRTKICGFDRTNAAKQNALRRFHHLMDVLEGIICLLKLLMQFS